MVAWAAMGDANASIPTPQPMLPRPMFGAAPGVAPALSVAWVAQAALDDGLADRLQVRRRLVPVADTRSLGKADMRENDAMPDHRRGPRHVRRDASTVSWSPRRPPPCCRWRSATSSSDACRRPPPCFLLADGRFPAGGHAQSAGVESAVRLGDVVDLATLERYLHGRLATTGVVEAAFAAAAAGADGDAPRRARTRVGCSAGGSPLPRDQSPAGPSDVAGVARRLAERPAGSPRQVAGRSAPARSCWAWRWERRVVERTMPPPSRCTTWRRR